MIFNQPPPDFTPIFEIAQCYLEHNGHLLLLRRLPEKSQGGKWGMPGGKVDHGEESAQAMVRELFEETGIIIKTDQLELLASVYVRYPDYDFKSHMYFAALPTLPAVQISQQEHGDYSWLPLSEALKLDLVLDQGQSFAIFASWREKQERA